MPLAWTAPKRASKAALPRLQNKMHINDWAAIQTLFDKLNKQLERTQKASAGQPGGVPGWRLPQLGVGACAACACFVDRRPSSAYGCRSPRA